MSRIPVFSTIINCIILGFVFGKAMLISLFEPGKQYVTKTSMLLVVVIIVGFIGIYFASRYYEASAEHNSKKIKISIVVNVLAIMLAFLMLLQGALIV